MIRPVRATVMAVAALLALAGIGACATVGNGGTGHASPLAVVATATPSPMPSHCTEDMDCWDCATMGNGVCDSPAPVATPDDSAADDELAASLGGTCQAEECYAPGDAPVPNSYECGPFSVEFHYPATASDTCWLRGMGQTVPMPGYVNSPTGLLPVEH